MTDIISSRGFISDIVKETSGKNAAPRNGEVSDRVQSQGSGGVESSVRAERS